jgi:hypothetical protein
MRIKVGDLPWSVEIVLKKGLAQFVAWLTLAHQDPVRWQRINRRNDASAAAEL